MCKFYIHLSNAAGIFVRCFFDVSRGIIFIHIVVNVITETRCIVM